mmetsp:Transcript_55766/g.146679  ORF Transcript_55766/g.146679 Transcript_55766/m.146679 type:complete len:251 (+) Transcript_55766:1625-2377(+)
MARVPPGRVGPEGAGIPAAPRPPSGPHLPLPHARGCGGEGGAASSRPVAHVARDAEHGSGERHRPLRPLPRPAEEGRRHSHGSLRVPRPHADPHDTLRCHGVRRARPGPVAAGPRGEAHASPLLLVPHLAGEAQSVAHQRAPDPLPRQRLHRRGEGCHELLRPFLPVQVRAAHPRDGPLRPRPAERGAPQGLGRIHQGRGQRPLHQVADAAHQRQQLADQRGDLHREGVSSEQGDGSRADAGRAQRDGPG